MSIIQVPSNTNFDSKPFTLVPANDVSEEIKDRVGGIITLKSLLGYEDFVNNQENKSVNDNVNNSITDNERLKREIEWVQNLRVSEREKIACNTNDIYILEALSYDESFDVKVAVAENINCSEITLLRLVQDSNDYIRSVIASNKKIKRGVVEILKKDENSRVIGELIENDNVTSNDIEFIYKRFKGVSEIEIGIAMCKKTPKDILIELFGNEDNYYSLAINSNTPEHILGNLYDIAKSNNYTLIIKYLANNSGIPDSLFIKIGRNFPEFIQNLKNTPKGNTGLFNRITIGSL